ncbi:MAG: ATP-dependent Clp protease proteolytic subunit, partial [Polyangiaceae bacterium]|nr:ATP-dependent Clp protease proteolytic subunit [Polyangiaceae bacterium]
QPYAKLLKDTDRNHWMNPVEAREYGLVSRIIQRASDVEVD